MTGYVVFPFSLRVYGVPQPQGSKRIGRHGRHPVILESNDATLRPWRAAVTAEARRVLDERDRAPWDVPLSLFACFTLARPKSAPKSRRYPTTKPDLGKLARAVEDALTDAGVWRDDSLVVAETITKRYVGDPLALVVPGVEIGVVPL